MTPGLAVTAKAAPKIGVFGADKSFDAIEKAASDWVTHTPLHNLVGTPAISVPMGFTSAPKLPLGVQIAAGMGRENLLLQLAYQLEEDAPWIDYLPPVHA